MTHAGDGLDDCAPAENTTPLPRFYSVGELAEIFGRSRRTIRGWLQSGKLPYVTFGNTRFVSAEVIKNPSMWKGA